MIETGGSYPRMKIKSALLLSLALSMVVSVGAQSRRSSSPIAKRSAGTVVEAIHLNNLGVAYMNQQQFARALRLFRQAAALNPKLDIAKTNEGIALANLQKYDAAAARLNVLVKKDPGNAQAWYTLGLVYKNQTESQ